VNPVVKAVAENSVQAYAEAVDEVLSNQDYRRSLELSAGEWAEKNSYRKAAEKILESLRDVRATDSRLPPDYEAMLERFYRSILKEGDVCIDVGAHVGRHAYPIAEAVGSAGYVVAFEPIPSLATALQEAIGQRGLAQSIEVRQLALADAPGTAKFIIAEDAPGYSGLRQRTYDSPMRTTEIDVVLSTLDGEIENTNVRSVDYIKIDAEGAEWSILQGARHTICKFKPVISFEFGEASYGAYDVKPEDVYDFFVANDYLVFDIENRNLSKEEFIASSIHQKLWDYLALHAESDRLSYFLQRQNDNSYSLSR